MKSPIGTVLCSLLIASANFTVTPDNPVGPVKPVEVVNGIWARLLAFIFIE